MNLTHHNRFSHFKAICFEISLRCGPPSPAERAFVCIRLIRLSVKGCYDEPSPLGKGDRSGAYFAERNSDAVAVDEVHRTDALLHLMFFCVC